MANFRRAAPVIRWRRAESNSDQGPRDCHPVRERLLSTVDLYWSSPFRRPGVELAIDAVGACVGDDFEGGFRRSLSIAGRPLASPAGAPPPWSPWGPASWGRPRRLLGRGRSGAWFAHRHQPNDPVALESLPCEQIGGRAVGQREPKGFVRCDLIYPDAPCLAVVGGPHGEDVLIGLDEGKARELWPELQDRNSRPGRDPNIARTSRWTPSISIRPASWKRWRSMRASTVGYIEVKSTRRQAPGPAGSGTPPDPRRRPPWHNRGPPEGSRGGDPAGADPHGRQIGLGQGGRRVGPLGLRSTGCRSNSAISAS